MKLDSSFKNRESRDGSQRTVWEFGSYQRVNTNWLKQEIQVSIRWTELYFLHLILVGETGASLQGSDLHKLLFSLQTSIKGRVRFNF